jgi:hypothetical protein|tara:strand:- start:2287 stop:3297 length:1011 start_codon:yes stop_codon:yes gene_type:complete
MSRMKIAWLSEGGYTGKVPRQATANAGVLWAWMSNLEVDHYPILNFETAPTDGYEYLILQVPKTPEVRTALFEKNIVKQARRIAKKILFFQEGPVWVYQDMPLEQQFWHYNTLVDVDLIFCENTTDISYYKGFVPGKPVTNLPDLIVDDTIKGVRDIEKQDKAIIGGNFCRWYGGFDSYIVAQEFGVPLHAPSMGRKIEGEEQIPDLTHLPFLNWREWMFKLAEFRYAIHLMQTYAAGSFMMNCGYLGIPCIGYNHTDTQRNIFPDLSIDQDDLETARKLARKLVDDKDFYNECSQKAIVNFEKHSSETSFNKWKDNFFDKVDDLIDGKISYIGDY